MFKFLIYLVSFLKLLALGKWYPPAHVRDVSAAEFNQLREEVSQLCDVLEAIGRQTEATRKKVYRDDGRETEVVPASLVPTQRNSPEQLLGSLHSGDEVPTGLF